LFDVCNESSSAGFAGFSRDSGCLLSNDLILLLTDEVAVIDEIQMIRDAQRGWAWTRALLGLIVYCTVC